MQDKVLLEANIVYNDIANIAVINATEIAKKKKMTVMDDDENSVIEEAAITVNEINSDQIPVDKDFEAYEEQVRNENSAREQNNIQIVPENARLNEVVNKNGDLQNGDAANQTLQPKAGESAEVAKSDNNLTVAQNNMVVESNQGEKTTALNVGGDAAITVNVENVSIPDAVKNENEQAKSEVKQETKEVKTEEKPKVKTYVRRTKRLPMFMMRPTPQTPEGFIAENFRLFVKRALLIKMQNEQTGTYPPPSYVLVNMPQKYAFIIDEINKETDNGLDFVFFNPEKENNLHLTNNLELYGALFIANYNKNHNF